MSWDTAVLPAAEEGLTAFGKEAVRRMESAGILPDVSHLNERGFWDVAQTAKGPFIASHSVSASIYPHAPQSERRAVCRYPAGGRPSGIERLRLPARARRPLSSSNGIFITISPWVGNGWWHSAAILMGRMCRRIGRGWPLWNGYMPIFCKKAMRKTV